eukprot:TRINITY_DN6337_c0_g1_i11.p1 TRINITY_DN6337_c0_g1~~TRINITY_DN6337_c0_g1_i11.p1  ORF type:complete len:490 (+),score=90.83 TRINITY_DN6337_c0_g1_i11:483-1952(+)
MIKARVQAQESRKVVTLRRLMMYKNFFQKCPQQVQQPPHQITKEKWRENHGEIFDLLSKSTMFCLLCMEEYRGGTEDLKLLSCNHRICKACWEDIHWLDDHQHQIHDLLDPNLYTKHRGYLFGPSAIPILSGSDDTLHNSSGRRKDSHAPEVHHMPSSGAGSSWKRILLLFRCPVCDEFQFERLKQYISSDVSLVRASERSIRIQGVLEEAEEGKVSLHKHISVSDIRQSEPITDSVFRARWCNSVVAVKYFKPYFIGFEWSRFRREVALLSMCDHQHIIELVGAYVPTEKEVNSVDWRDDSTPVKPFIVLEYFPDTLSEVIRTAHRLLPIQTALLFSYQMASAIHFLHSIGVAHRDLKPANCVVSQDGKMVKLIDFGESRILKNKDRLTKVGTPFYEAPEVSKGTYNEKVDSYSFGKMVYEILTKSLNPTALAQRDFYDRFTIEAIQFEMVSEELHHLVVNCCQISPHLRPDFETISKQLYQVQSLDG